MKDHIARVIREARTTLGLTQEELAARAGLATQSLSNLERGKAAPSVVTLARISEELQIPIGRFFQSHGVRKTEHRLELEAKVAVLIDRLNDQEVEVAAGLIAVLVRVYSEKDPT
jgi:transcriptional regulator with XRE-family HTH domain